MTPSKLRVGLLLDALEVCAWEHRMFRDIIESDFAEVVLVVVNDLPRPEPTRSIIGKLRNNFGQITRKVVRKGLEAVYTTLIERKRYLPDAFEITDCRDLLKGVPILPVKPHRKRFSDYFRSEDLEAIRGAHPDILVRCGFGILRGEVLTVARHGIWSFHHGDNRVNRGGPPGFWESMESWPVTGSILQILTEDLDNGRVLYRSASSTHRFSVGDNKSNYYWKTQLFMTRKMKELHEVGPEAFFEKVEHDNRHPEIYSERLYRAPTNRELARLTYRKVLEKARQRLSNIRYFDQWILLFHLKEELSSSLWRYRKLIPPKDRFWADPHVVRRDGLYYVFIEEYLYSSAKGHISVMTIADDGTHTEPRVVLDRPYHMSYPFIVEHEGEHYMIPETMKNGTIELYRCVEFPGRWEFQMNLMEDIQAVDSSVFFHEGRWWLFANVVATPGASTLDELFLYSSDNLPSDSWAPHPMNPIVSDCREARPAGRIFTVDGRIYRPSQNSATRYGYGFNISEITALSEEEYAEVVVSRVEPNWDERIRATHTFSRVGALHVIDGLYRRRK